MRAASFDQPLAEELALYLELGLVPPRPMPGQTWYTLGRVTRGRNWVTIASCGVPAECFRCTIGNGERGSTTTLTTSGGTLVRHWPVLEAFLDGMIAVQSVVRTEPASR